MSINKIAVYQGGRWVTEPIGVAASAISGSIASSQITSIDASKISGSIASSQINSLAGSQITGSITNATVPSSKISGTIATSQISSSGTLSNTIHLGTNQTQHVLVAGIDVHGNLVYPANEIQLSNLYDLTGKIQPQIDNVQKYKGAVVQAYGNGTSNLAQLNMPSIFSSRLPSSASSTVRFYSSSQNPYYSFLFVGLGSSNQESSTQMSLIYAHGTSVTARLLAGHEAVDFSNSTSSSNGSTYIYDYRFHNTAGNRIYYTLIPIRFEGLLDFSSFPSWSPVPQSGAD